MRAGQFVLIAFVLGLSGGAGLTAFGAQMLEDDPNSGAYNNPSFETPDVAEGPFEVSLSAPPWTLTGPTVMTPTPFGTFPLLIGCGIFDNPSGAGQISNVHQEQLAYIFANSYAGAMPGDPTDHSFTQILTQTYQADSDYTLAIGIAHAQQAPPADSVLTMSLFAYDSGNPGIVELVASTPITVANVNGVTLTDFFATATEISPTAVGKQIGIRISTHTALKTPAATGQFDFDNVRLNVVPEPASAGILGAGILLLGARRRR